MPLLLLTPASISYLNQFLLALVITVYLARRFGRKGFRRASTTDRLLTFFFVATTLFSLGLFLEASLPPTERLLAVYALNTLLALLLVALIQFAYFYPLPSSKQTLERRLALLLSLSYLAWELATALERFSLLREARVIFRAPEMDYPPVFLFAWAAFVFARGTLQNWRDASSRRFAAIFLIPLTLAAMNIVRSYAGVSNPVYHISMSVGILATIFLFALNYLNAQPESTSLMVKFSGAILTAILSLFGMIAWLVTPAYAAQYRPPLLDHRSIRFTPHGGGYEITEIPFRFETDMGQKLDLADSSRLAGSDRNYLSWAFDFPFYGRRYSQVFIGDNGLISFGEPVSYWSLEYRLSSAPVFFALYLDLKPEGNPQGGVYLREEAERLVVTYNRVQAFYRPGREYTFQVVLYSDGRIDLTYNGLPESAQYEVNDRPDASVWVVGAKPGLDSGRRVSFAALPISTGAEGAIDDQFLAFRRYLHDFLAPLAASILLSSLTFLVGLPWLTSFAIARPLQALVAGMERFNREQKSANLPVQYRDEIGFLTESFNSLTGALDDLIHNLETRVAERTAELRKLSVAVEQSPSVIVITNLRAEIEYVNEAFIRSTGYAFEEVKGKNPRLLQSGQTPPETFRNMWRTLRAGKTWRGELVNRRKNGEVYWEYTVIAPIHDADGNVAHYVAVKEDVTARKAAEEKLEQLAVTDPLTGLFNRRGFFQEAEKVYARCFKPPYELAALMMDIDHFKSVNDRYGHQAGDAVLREVAARVCAALRPSDLIARYGGEEFVALLPRASRLTLEQIARRIIAVIRETPVVHEGVEIAVTISVGGAMLSAETRSLDELLSQADQTMYQAKAAGRNCAMFFDETQKKSDLP